MCVERNIDKVILNTNITRYVTEILTQHYN